MFSAVPKLYRVFVLLVASLLFFAMTGPFFLGIMLASVLTDYLLSRPIFIHGKGDKRSRTALFLAAAKSILLMVAVSVGGQLSSHVVTIGIMIYTSTSLGYLIDLYNGEEDPITSIYDYLLFCCFFGKLYVGPIVSAHDFCGQLRDLRPSLSKMSDGFVWFCHGLGKIVILANSIALMGDALKAIPYLEKTVTGVWLLIICYLFATYFTLSGYSDMARGIGALFSISLPENFHYPLQSETVTDFFSNFNISANRFIRKYIYGALGAEDNGAFATTINIMLITMIMGLWYGISLNFLVWGAVLGIFIVMETLLGDKYFLHVPSVLRKLGTLTLVVISFAVFCSGSLGQAVFYLQTMFGVGSPALIDNQVLYLLSSNAILLLLCVVLS
ncbi:MAG: MBOAT family O-acyltransferase, partial [Angelakisella sp.]